MFTLSNTEIEFATARGAIYEFLSASFSEPPCCEMLKAVLSAIAEGEGSITEIFEAADRLSLEDLRVCAQEALESDAKMKVLRQEFMDLFKVPGGKYVAPYESVYRDSREIEGTQVSGLLMGSSAIDAQRWYRLGAAEMTDHIKELPDHIAVELGFMAYLCRTEQEFQSTGDRDHAQRAREMEHDFLEAHILSWVGDLCDRIRKKSNHVYFNSVGQLALSFAEHDLRLLSCCSSPNL